MKTYRVRHDGLCFEFDLPEKATTQDVKTEVLRIINDKDALLEACKKGFARKDEQIEFWKKESDFWMKACTNEHEITRAIKEIGSEILVIPSTEKTKNRLELKRRDEDETC